MKIDKQFLSIMVGVIILRLVYSFMLSEQRSQEVNEDGLHEYKANLEKEKIVPQILGGKITIQKEGPWFFGTCTGTKGSGVWLREWLEHQLLVGVDHVWIVDDNPPESQEVTKKILQEYEKLGYVTVIPGRMPKSHPGCKQLGGPAGVHNCVPPKVCFEHASPHVNWLLFADTDEFIFPHTSCSIRDHIETHCSAMQSHILVRWERFGTSGFEQHPQGLMTENFLTSGGDCSKPGPFFDFFGNHCSKHPFAMCGECRHTKVIWNTGQCATLDHAGWIHWPTNTTDWKDDMTPEKRKDHYKIWTQSEGLGAHWKSDNCTYATDMKDQWRCEQWLYTGGGSTAKREYSSKCCSAGLGYNHYGTKSLQYYVQKKTTPTAESKRGFRAPLLSVDLNSTISFSILRFTRALRRRFKEIGHTVSENTHFIDLEGPGEHTCFSEQNFQYIPDMDRSTTTTKYEHTNSISDCCSLCFVEQSCAVWTYHREEALCILLQPASHVPTSIDPKGHRVAPYHALAARKWDVNYVSGAPLRSGECLK